MNRVFEEEGWGLALQAVAHELLAFVALERLGLGVGVTGLHFFLLRGLGICCGRRRVGAQAGFHGSLVFIALFALESCGFRI